ncbi:polysaccharide biosynthesis/export family protein [Thalassobius vesicularis]|uniref:polysaccharide biosynthesis/export family protein n=1 Tax=Thalassobius vesicularis TaxID=1294297 RepID=UPI001FE4B607|nr:polysaccharide biosynthesis/export family protein [Thalassobius vesicularis]
MTHFLKLSVLALALALPTACTSPRGAALTSEILREQDKPDAGYAVMPVTRANVSALQKWPGVAGNGTYHWIGNNRGPDSPVIRTGDQIDLVIWDNQENSLLASGNEKSVNMKGLQVSTSGTIFVPYLDEVQIRGMTPDQARRHIQESLAPIVPQAQVQLALSAGKQNSVDLVSGVETPGTYPLPDRNYSILSLIAQGGGINKSMRNPLVRLQRNGGSYAIPASALFEDPRKNVPLRGNDKVIVEEDDRYFTALGATGKEELVYFTKENVTALESLSMMGGLSEYRANLKGVLVLREYPAEAVRYNGSGPASERMVFTFDLTSADGLFAARKFPIQPEDTVIATESPLSATRTILGLIGTVFGVVNVAPGG